jgi:hypothetical protein
MDMKILLILSIAAVTHNFNCNEKVPSVSRDCAVALTKDLLAHYPFDGNANDVSGNNKHGEPKNGVSYGTDGKGQGNMAASFDGKDDWINIPDKTSYFAKPKMTISFFLYLNDVSERCNIITKSAFSQPTGHSWGAFVTNKLTFRAIGNEEDCDALWYDNADYDLNSKSTLKNKRWYHICLVFNEGLSMIYMDGKLESARMSEFATLKNCKNADLKIAGWWQEDIISMHGKLDDLRIYGRILSESEINTLASGY